MEPVEVQVIPPEPDHHPKDSAVPGCGCSMIASFGTAVIDALCEAYFKPQQSAARSCRRMTPAMNVNERLLSASLLATTTVSVRRCRRATPGMNANRVTGSNRCTSAGDKTRKRINYFGIFEKNHFPKMETFQQKVGWNSSTLIGFRDTSSFHRCRCPISDIDSASP